MSGPRAILRDQRRRGIRGGPHVTHACYLWRISAIAQRLHHLLDLEACGARTPKDVERLTHLENRVEKMLRSAHASAIRAALPQHEERVCDG